MYINFENLANSATIHVTEQIMSQTRQVSLIELKSKVM